MILLCACGDGYETEVGEVIQTLCPRCSVLVADPNTRIEAPCWRGSGAVLRAVREDDVEFEEVRWGA